MELNASVQSRALRYAFFSERQVARTPILGMTNLCVPWKPPAS